MYYEQRIVQLYFDRKLSYGKVSKALKEKGLTVCRQTVWKVVNRYKKYGTICRLPGSGGSFKMTPEMLKLIEDQLQADDEVTASQLHRILTNKGYRVSKSTIIRARRLLGWTFHGSRYCQMIREKNKEKRLKWAEENMHSGFEDVLLQESRCPSEAKTLAQASL